MPGATAAAEVLPDSMGATLNRGTYSLSDFPVGITFEIPPFEPPARWIACSASAVEQAACYRSVVDQDIPPGAVTFQVVDNVVADPCSDQESAELLDPPVGPSVEDLATAISSLQGYEATAPEDVTVSGFEGVEFTLTAPETAGCGSTWATADRTTGVGAGEINLIRIVDVNGVRVVIVAAYHPVTPEADVATLEQVMDSVQIEP
jgi:hypothetical protein